MTQTVVPSDHALRVVDAPRYRSLPGQRGVVLIIAMIALVIISLLAIASMRNAGSADAVLGNVRTTELAAQAAEIALRHCEASAIKFVQIANGDTASAAATYDDRGFGASRLLSPTTPARWTDASVWNTATTSSAITYALPLDMLNQASMTTTYQRPPECMVEEQPYFPTGTSNYSTQSFVVSARGFGPDVPALTGTTRIRPVGTVVLLQSTLGLD